MSRHLTILTLVILLTSLGGCGGDSATDKSSSSGAASGGSSNAAQYDSPQAVYTALAEATKKNDWKNAASMLTRESQAVMAGGMIMGASFMTMGDESKEKEFSSLLARHGVDLDEDTEPPADIEDVDPGAMMLELTKPVKDMPSFIGEINAWMDKNGDESGGGFAKMGELGEVTIEGDTAKATAQTDMGPQPIEFRKVGDGWLVHLPLDGPPGGPGGVGEMEEEPDDGTPGLGTMSFGDKSFKLRHAYAYKSTFFDDPCTVLLLTTKPIYERDMNELKKSLEDGTSEDFMILQRNVKLSLDADGKLLFLFSWVDNMSINSNSGVDMDVKIEGNHLTGTAAMTEPQETHGGDFTFQAEFDVDLLKPEG